MVLLILAVIGVVLVVAASAANSWWLVAGVLLLYLGGYAIVLVTEPQMLPSLIAGLAAHGPATTVVLWAAFVATGCGGAAVGWHLRASSQPAPAPVPGGGMPAEDPYAGLLGGLPRFRLVQVLGTIFAACLLLGLVGVAIGQLSMPRALLLAVFATAAVATLLQALDALRFEPLELESSWGGLGGGLGGWRLSQPAVLLLLAIGFAGAATMVGILPAQPEAKTAASETTDRSVTVTLHSGTAKSTPGNKGGE